MLAPAAAAPTTINLNIGREVIDLLRGNLNVSDVANPSLGSVAPAASPNQEPVPITIPVQAASNPAIPRYDLQCPTFFQADRLPGPDMSIYQFCDKYELDYEIRKQFIINGYKSARALRFVTPSDAMNMGLRPGDIAELREAIERWSVAR